MTLQGHTLEVARYFDETTGDPLSAMQAFGRE